LPASLGHFVSHRILNRWEREEQRYGTMLKGSRNQIDYFHRRAVERPLIYDFIATLGRGPYSAGLLRKLAAALRGCDVVQVGFTPFATTWQVVAMARVFRKPVVVLALFHPEDLSHHFRSIYWSLSAADAVLAQTAYSAAILKRLLPRSNPVEVGAGVNLDELAAACGARFRGKYGFRDRKIVLLVGRKEFFKRYDLAIAAVEMLHDERIALVMIGRDIDGKTIDSARVRFMGEVNHQDLIDAYDACDVFLLPSENESFGMVLLEAWARRKPVIGNRSSGPVACLIDDGENGYLSSTAEEMTTRIAHLIANPELSQKLGQAGYQKVVRRYTWDAIAKKVRELYSQLANAILIDRQPHQRLGTHASTNSNTAPK